MNEKVKYYLIGESHGSNECPKACLSIIAREDIWQLALEFGNHLQPEMEEFLNDRRSIDDLTIFKNPTDSRATRAMRRLIQTAKNWDLMIYFVDDWSGSPDRERLIAENLQKIEGRVAFYCGSAHAAKQSTAYEHNFEVRFSGNAGKVFDPCGSFLPQDRVISYNIKAVNGGMLWDSQRLINVRPHPYLSERYKDRKLPTIVELLSKKRYNFLYLIDKFSPSQNIADS